MSLKLISISLVTIMSLVGAGYFYRKKSDDSATESNLSIFLYSLFGVFFCTFIQYAFGYLENNLLVIFCSYLMFSVVLTVAPSMYLYVASVFTDDRTKEILNNKLLHYALPIGLFVFNLFCFAALITLEPDSKNYQLLEEIIYFVDFVAFIIVFLMQNTYYIISAWLLYFKEKDYFKDSKDREAFKLLQWVRWFVILYMIVIISMYLVQLDWGIMSAGKYLFRLGLLGYLFFVIYRGREYQSHTIEVIRAKGLEEGKILELKEKLLKLIDEEKPYLNVDLSLKGLASDLGSNSKYLSYLINTEFESNFSTFINIYRIEEAKLKLKDPANNIYTIQSIAEMTGFKSKSSFNKAFKDHTGLTPSQFRAEDDEQDA